MPFRSHIEPKLSKAIKRVSLNFRRLRSERKWTQAEIAEKADCDLRWYQRLESGVYVLSLETLVKFAHVFHVDIAEFFKDRG